MNENKDIKKRLEELSNGIANNISLNIPYDYIEDINYIEKFNADCDKPIKLIHVTFIVPENRNDSKVKVDKDNEYINVYVLARKCGGDLQYYTGNHNNWNVGYSNDLDDAYKFKNYEKALSTSEKLKVWARQFFPILVPCADYGDDPDGLATYILEQVDKHYKEL